MLRGLRFPVLSALALSGLATAAACSSSTPIDGSSDKVAPEGKTLPSNAVAVLFDKSGSACVPDTTAPTVRVPDAVKSTAASSVTVRVAPAGITPSPTVTLPPELVAAAGVVASGVRPVGAVSTSRVAIAESGPVLVIVNVNETGSPAATTRGLAGPTTPRSARKTTAGTMSTVTVAPAVPPRPSAMA